MVTLPESLLLQNTAGQDQDSLVAESGVVQKARESFFKADQPWTAIMPLPATTTAAAPLPMTTQDPAALAKQLGITKDQAQARNLVVSMVDRAQLSLLLRIKDVDADLDAMAMRAKEDLKAVNHSFQVAENLPISAANTAADIDNIKANSHKLQDSTLPAIVNRSTATETMIKDLLTEKDTLKGTVKKGDKIPGAAKRVTDNTNVMTALVPRLKKLEKKVTRLEARMYDGNLTALVDETARQEVVNIMEDVSRGFGRFIENP